MKRLEEVLRVLLILGGVIFFVGCGHPQNEPLGNSLKYERATVTTTDVNNIAQEKEGTTNTNSKEEIPNNVEQKEKILIGQFSNVEFEWCGTNALIVKNSNTIEWIDILGKKRLKINEIDKDWEYKILRVTADGKWIVYTDREKNLRLAPWLKSSPIKEARCLDRGEWDGNIGDVYRYEVSSGEKEKVGIIYSGLGCLAISPDSRKIFLGKAVSQNLLEKIDMDEPKWEILYFEEEDWVVGDSAVWFQDSSGVITDENEMWGDEGKLFVEIFGRDGWHKVFDTGLGNIYDLQAHKDKTFYFRGAKEEALSKFSLYEGKINKNGNLSCKEILTPREGNIEKYVVLPNSSIVFWERGSRWIRCVDPQQMKEKWVVKVENRQVQDMRWVNVGQMKVSPDGRWLAYIESSDNNSLFVIKLK